MKNYGVVSVFIVCCMFIATSFSFFIMFDIAACNPTSLENSLLIQENPPSHTVAEQITAYLDNGEFNKALKLARRSISQDNIAQSTAIIDILVQSRSQRAFDEVLKNFLQIEEGKEILTYLISKIGSTQFVGTEEALLPLLHSNIWNIRSLVAEVLGEIGSRHAIEPLIPLLRDSEYSVRKNASDALIQLSTSTTQDLLFPLLKDEQPSVRGWVAQTLRGLGDKRAVVPLSGLLQDTSPEVRRSAAITLGELGYTEAIDSLVASLHDHDPYVCLDVAVALGKLGDLRTEEALHLLATDKNSVVRGRAVKALALLDSVYAVAPLLDLLTHDKQSHLWTSYVWSFQRLSHETVIQAIDSILTSIHENNTTTWRFFPNIKDERITDAFIAKLTHRDLKIRATAIKMLGKHGDARGFEALLDVLNEHDELQESAIEALIQLDSERAVPFIIPFLQADDNSVRDTAAKALGKTGDDRAVGPLIAMLSDRNRPLYDDEPVEALGWLGDERAIEPLTHVAYTNTYLRDTAAEALYWLGSEQALEPLLRLLHSEYSSVQRRAIEMLGELGNEQTVIPVLEFLSHSDEDVRRNTVKALGLLGGTQAIAPLITLLHDEDRMVQHHAAEALGRIGHVNAIGPLLGLITDEHGKLLSSKDIALEPVEALMQLGSGQAIPAFLHLLAGEKSCPDSVNYRWEEATQVARRLNSSRVIVPLMNLLTSGCDDIAPNAADSLGELGPVQVIRPLIADLVGNERRYRYYNAANALGQIGDQQAVEPLLTQLTDESPWRRAESAKALGQLGDIKAIEPLIPLLNDLEGDVRQSAVMALAKLSATEAIPHLKSLYEKQSGNSVVIAAALLALGEECGIETLRKIVESPQISPRKSLAELLGEMPSGPGNALLLRLLNDKNLHVRVQTILSLGHAGAVTALPQLHPLTRYPNIRIREAVVKTLVDIAAPESIDWLREIALNPEERVSIRFTAIEGLGKIGTVQAVSALLDVLDMMDEQYYLKTVFALGNTRSHQALPKLLKLLKEPHGGKMEFSADSREYVETFATSSYKKFAAAYAITLIAPYSEGVNLLAHESDKAREGAWLALAKPSLTRTRPFLLEDGRAAVKLLQYLDFERRQSRNPAFRHAAYRAIDGLLVTLEAYGGTTELYALKALQPSILDTDGVLTRIEWTIARLREREE